jgi:hypothetical protein
MTGSSDIPDELEKASGGKAKFALNRETLRTTGW